MKFDVTWANYDAVKQTEQTKDSHNVPFPEEIGEA
jgi:hypothetical protein